MMEGRLREAIAGGVMTVFGLAVLLEARSYGIGTPQRMGPGLYPMILGGALVIVGVLIAMSRDAAGEDGGASKRPDWRGWSCIIAGMASFIVIGERLGLGPATFACVLVSAFGDRQNSPTQALALAGVATAMAALVFSWLLKFPLPFLAW